MDYVYIQYTIVGRTQANVSIFNLTVFRPILQTRFFSLLARSRLDFSALLPFTTQNSLLES